MLSQSLRALAVIDIKYNSRNNLVNEFTDWFETLI